MTPETAKILEQYNAGTLEADRKGLRLRPNELADLRTQLGEPPDTDKLPSGAVDLIGGNGRRKFLSLQDARAYRGDEGAGPQIWRSARAITNTAGRTMMSVNRLARLAIQPEVRPFGVVTKIPLQIEMPVAYELNAARVLAVRIVAVGAIGKRCDNLVAPRTHADKATIYVLETPCLGMAWTFSTTTWAICMSIRALARATGNPACHWWYEMSSVKYRDDRPGTRRWRRARRRGRWRRRSFAGLAKRLSRRSAFTAIL